MEQIKKHSSIFREAEGVIPNTLAISYAVLSYIGGFLLMAADSWILNIVGVILSTHAMMIAAYLIHEAAHYTLFAKPATSRAVGELVNFIAGSSYASFERIRHMHLRHHRDRADISCFNYRVLLERHPIIRKAVYVLEWLYVPAVEIIYHTQVILRPFFVASQRKHLPRVVAMLIIRLGLLAIIASYSIKAVILYFIAYGLFLTTLNFFDAFHHTFQQFFVEAEIPVSMDGRDREYEQANTYSNVISVKYPMLNLLTLNFGYHNAHHERAAMPWYRLPALHKELYGTRERELLPLPELLRTFHRNRMRRILDEDYGNVAQGSNRADSFVGAHGVSFLTVV